MASFTWPPQDQIAEFPTLSAFPPAGPSGSFAYAQDTQNFYASNGSAWVEIAGPGSALSLGSFGSTPSAAGAALTAGVLQMQPADGTHPGEVSTSAQTLGGKKTFAAGLDAGGNKITGVADPTVSTDAATKNYTDLTFIPLSQRGAASGVATLDGSGKVPVAQLPSVVMEFQGLWNPSTNTPALADSTGTNGNVYVVTTAFAGPISGLNNATMVNFNVGDLVIYSASAGQWEHTTPAAGVSSVNGAQGAVTVNAINQLTGDVTAGPASGSQSAAATLATVNSNVGSFTNASVTVNAKGLVTAASSGAAPLINPMTTLGDMIYENATPAAARLAGSTSSTTAVLTQTGNGTVSAAPAWTSTTGTGNAVLATAPTLTNPVVGTQATTDNSTKAASTAYVTTAVANAVAGVNPAVAVQAATTAASDTSGFTYNNGVSGVGATFTGSTNTAVTIDGFTFTALGQRLLVKNDTQSPSGAFNGIYYVTQVQTALLPPILTRALDYDQPSDINNTGAIPVVNGTVNGTTSWLLTSTVNTVGTDPLTYTKFSVNPSTILTNPMTTAGDMIYGGSSGTPTRMANGTSGQVPVSTGSTVGFSSLPGNSTALKAPTAQSFTSTGTQTGWLFTISTPTTCAVGDTYTNNGNTFTVQGALSAQSGQVLFMSGTGATSGTTLTRSTGSGTSSITFSTKILTATYTTPSSPAPLYLKIKMAGGGGGGGGGGSTGATSGGDGLASFFGANILTCSQGHGGGVGGATGGSGGTTTISSPALTVLAQGGTAGGGGGANGNLTTQIDGSVGGNNAFGGFGFGGGGGTTQAGGPAISNSGCGGGGGATGDISSVGSGAGGGAAGYAEALIGSPGASYPYIIGTGGGGGSAGTSGAIGGAGAAGIVIVEEFYQ